MSKKNLPACIPMAVLAVLTFLVGCSSKTLERGFYGVVEEYLQWRGVERKTVRIPMGHTVGYLESGDPRQPALLLLHGFGADPMTTWLDLMPRLSDRWRLLAPSMLYATQNPFRPADYELADERQALVEFLDRLEVTRVSIIAMSCGACVAVDLALARPDLVDRLVLVAMPVSDIEPQVSAALREGRLPGLYRSLFYRPPPMPDLILDNQVERIEAMGDRFPDLLRTIDQGCRCVRERLSQAPQPTLLVWGVRDTLFPLADGRRLSGQFPEAEFVFFMESGHAVTWDQPEQLSEAAARFLKGETR